MNKYLKDDKNSVFREKLVNYKFFYEVKHSAAKAKTDIKIYNPEVDRDGYDVLLDDGERIVPFQLKTFLSTSRTSKWEIRKGLLRPLHYNCQSLGFEFSPEGEGIEGGFILVEIEIKDNEISDFEFYYTDCYILTAFESGLIKHKNKTYSDKLQNFLTKLRKGFRGEKIEITSLCLVKVKSVDDILALSGLPSIKQRQWRIDFKNSYNDLITGTISPEDKENLIDILKSHIDDNELKIV
jgi:hypothetical protein